MRTAHRTRRTRAGATLLEVVFAIVVLCALVKFAMMKLVTPATMTLPTQVQSVADLIRRAQSLAVVRGQRMSVVATAGTNGRIAAACVASAPCNTDTSLAVSQGVVMGSASTLYFNSLGQPVSSAGAALGQDASFTLCYQTGANAATTYAVTVAALTGQVSISLPSATPSVCP